MLFNSELEVEHASTEHSGEVSLEFGYLDFLNRPAANIRAGLVIVPMGIINEQHEPTSYLGANRPQTERFIIPSTWSEIGAGVFGESGAFSYRGFVMTGLNSSEFTGDEGIREGRQGGSESIAEDLAVVGRLDWHPMEGAIIGGSLYSGGSGQTAAFKGRVTLAEVHGDAKFRGLSLRALAARAHIGDAGAISAANGDTIGSAMGGWYAEAGYDLASILSRSFSITPYARYERIDTNRRVASSFTRNRENDRRITTLGVAFKPIAQTVIKTGWQQVKRANGTSDSEFNVALGYIF